MCDREYESIEVRLPSERKYAALARALIGDFARLPPLTEEDVEDLKLAVSEAYANAVRHAYREEEGGGQVWIRCVADGTCVVAEVADTGTGFDAEEAERQRRRRSPLRDNGYGMILIRSFMDEVRYERNGTRGTVVRMVKRCSRGSQDRQTKVA